ncbi:DegT/DnrJ/EryC1/StrS family aminotransferase [Streptomyces sp. H39-C1]|uniref:DegT/DnrJ/EryC1/StrS family aminotransferase n=1 Tax=Streptomyces sp. H39-C1 TaxID=3004355 RepID=UPI0022AFEA60|nr:DegT/DnrJ/EryC1/StrS family aminotransferase [Streptomyces sp. H39-C1]MCZ4098069.1 DegT/DnrJ/EryC1/StrS family aminotransferase [Streptomyces sp. H39-C1]
MTTAPSSTAAAARSNARPFLHGTEFAAAADAMREGQYGHGVLTELFEQDVARFLGVPDVVAVSSGTMALHIALLAAGIGPGDEVIVPSQTFAATIQAIVACGAHPRFIEINPDTLCIESQSVLEAITSDTRAVMPVLFGGRAVDLNAVHDVLGERDITVIEDAAHAFGSYTATARVGATRTALTCFSFGPIKNLTCLEGGALVPRTAHEADIARQLRLLGINQPQSERISTTSYTVGAFGLRGTMSSIHAAVGSAQLDQFPLIEAKRKNLWRAYAAGLRQLDGVALVDLDVDRTVPFNCVVRVPHRDDVHRILHQQGIGVGVHYPPNHLQPAFSPWYRSLPVTETVAGEMLSLPFHPYMSIMDVQHVVAALGRAVTKVRTDPAAEAS